MLAIRGIDIETYEPNLTISNGRRSIKISGALMIRDFLSGKNRPWIKFLQYIN